ncbi:MAG: AAA family ATPase, partial [Alphaproteobacteria bacterium]|nr:AAA family ATPase [Alphaproteobacteria bacterium]
EAEPLAVRIGIATGSVVIGDIVGEGGAQEAAVLGETPNLAARLQAIAEPNTVVTAQTTHTLASGLFDYDALGEHSLKGIERATEVWRVVGERRAESRFAAMHASALTPLVGRDEEMEMLTRRWQRAKDGAGQVVLLAGEPGIGKSRLARTLQDTVADEPHTRLLFQCSPHHTSSALYPVIAQLERATLIEAGEPVDAKLDKLHVLLAQSGQSQDEAMALIAALLSIPTEERYPLPELTPLQQKDRTLAALSGQLIGLAAQQPVLFIFEDAHWIDPTSLELLELAVERIKDLPVLMIITYRPEFAAPWVGGAHVSLQALSRLAPHDCTRMVERLTGERTLSPEILAQIAERTDGVPLFIEEMTRSVLEMSADFGDAPAVTGQSVDLAVPTSLQDALEARLDRSPAVREVAQVGAAIGREFPYDLLARVVSLTTVELDAALDDLAGSGLIFARGAPPNASYTFKHALIQDTGYSSMVRGTRHDTHKRIVDILLELRPETAETGPELLAHHYTEAGLLDEAVDWWTRAGRAAAARSANPEAVALLVRGLDLVAELPVAEARDRRELALQTALFGPLITVKGQTSPELEAAFNRSLELCEHVDAPTEWFRATVSKWLFHAMSEEMTAAFEVAETFMQRAELAADDGVLVVGKGMFGRSLFWLGRLPEALEHIDQALTTFDRERHGHLMLDYVYDPEVTIEAYRAATLWLLGWPDTARESSDRAVSQALELGHLASLVPTLCWGGVFPHTMLRDIRAMRQIGKHIDFVISQHDMPVVKVWARMVSTLVEISARPTLRAATELGDGISLFVKATRGPSMLMPMLYCWLAETYLAVCEPAQALEALTVGLELTVASEERWSEAEIHRIRGLALAVAGGSEANGEAEASMLKALTVAKSQSAKSLELRAATSLARLLRDQGRLVEADEILAPVYGWFTEGFGTPDLRDAKALLDELS